MNSQLVPALFQPLQVLLKHELLFACLLWQELAQATAVSRPCFWRAREPSSGTPSPASPGRPGAAVARHLFDALQIEYVCVPVAGLGKQHL